MAPRILVSVLLIAGTAFLAGCGSSRPRSRTVVVATHSGYGPPPHAPAHGYRHKHGDGVDLVYDSSLKVYVVAGNSGLYYSNGNYYRHHGSQWQFSTHFGGPWKSASHSKLPPKLKKLKRSKGH